MLYNGYIRQILFKFFYLLVLNIYNKFGFSIFHKHDIHVLPLFILSLQYLHFLEIIYSKIILRKSVLPNTIFLFINV